MNDLVAMQQEVEPALNNTAQLMEKTYLHKLTDYKVVSIDNQATTQNTTRQIRLFQIEKIVYDKKEDIAEKLVNVYNALGNLNNSLFLIIDSDGNEVELYIGTRSDQISVAQESLMRSMKGNFPGTKLKKIRNSDYIELMDKVTMGNKERLRRTVASVTGIPALKDTDKQTYVQGLEKLINAMHGEKFSMIVLADSVSPQQASTIRQGYENMYSAISRFQKIDYSVGENESAALTEGMSEGLSEAINDSIGQTQSYSKTITEGTSESKTKGKSRGASVTPFGVGVNESSNSSKTSGKTSSEAFSNTDGTTDTRGTTHSTNRNMTTGSTKTDGTSKTLQVHMEDKRVTELLEKIDSHLNRLNSAADLGLWHYATYFLADDEQTATIAAANYQAIIRGAESAIEGSAINIWNSGHIYSLPLRESLKVLQHPQFHVNHAGVRFSTGSTLVNTRELSIACGLPRKSINGLPVVEMAEFGRDVSILSSKVGQATINLGSIYYMGEKDSTPVQLDVNSLAMHTFITGSTGSGKSNTVYQMLDELLKENVKFLVIEPAKGEYKNVFGGYTNVHVFGTNPKFTPLLKINPFYFPDNIHVLEHIERLIEIFNACWPMYAAMPAVLREAVEEVYRECGWKLDASINFNRIAQYPTMQQLVQVLPNVIEKSGYSEEVKSNYVGALVTRVKSLMTGLLSNVFVEDEIDNEILFDENCIIDLSLIGSVETKSLVMGILFMRLQEHRMASADGMNVPLKHVTVLEEAHHLLRRTSDVQTAEGSNLQGKSVEMITNGIAEMRTYGEGFIIADQSPNLLDPSAIRNTNTKIIMRLPDAADRTLVGASAGLNEEQLKEISKLETGVAVVYQNNWLEPVLCQVPSFDDAKKFVYSFNIKNALRERRENASYIIEAILSGNIDKQTFIRVLETNTKLHGVNRMQLVEEVTNDLPLTIMQRGNEAALGEVINSYAPIQEILPYSQTAPTLEEFDSRFQKALTIYVDSSTYKDIIQELLLIHYCAIQPSFKPFYFRWFENKKQGVIV
ncbi:helicase HerA domain-containing protein [Planococcus sp. X10-3]|uniref:ATP-binding protein n=1 Tax=Planococcus sp. X10-3 TaxID=3061240 RepID=UPI003BAEFCAA